MKHTFYVLGLLFFTLGSTLANDTGDTFNGQPVGPNLTPDDAKGYVDSVVKNWLAESAVGVTVTCTDLDFGR
jgi:hypothetical protein